MSIEKKIEPKANVLIDEDGVFTMKIVDAELDIFECNFDGDGAVIIDTSNCEYICLDIPNLKLLISTIIKVDKILQ